MLVQQQNAPYYPLGSIPPPPPSDPALSDYEPSQPPSVNNPPPQEPQLGPPPVVPEEPKLGPPPVVPEEPKLGPPPVVPEEPKLGPPPVVPQQTTVAPAPVQQQAPVPVQQQKVVAPVQQKAAAPAQQQKTSVPIPSQAKVVPAQGAAGGVKPAQANAQPAPRPTGPMNTLMLAKQTNKTPVSSPGKPQAPRAAPVGGAALKPLVPPTGKLTGDALAAPIQSVVTILKFMKNDAITANSTQKRTLMDTARRLELIVDNPFKDVAELLMMDASMGTGAETSCLQQLTKACDKTVAALLRLLPKCTADMPIIQARMVATFVRRIVEVIHSRDEAELALYK